VKHLIISCQYLFNIKPIIANGIIPLLRIEDVKITFAKTFKKSKSEVIKKTINSEKISDNNYKLLKDSYNTLIHYILNHNIEITPELELSNQKSSNCAYLYPIYKDFSKIKPVNQVFQNNKTLYYAGKILPKKLRFGTFLYYKGVISYYMLLESLAWQKSRRPLLGQIAMQLGLISPENFAKLLLHTKNGYSFGESAKNMHLLTESVIKKIVKKQETYNCKIGSYFIEKRILSTNQIDFFYNEMKTHNKLYSSC